MGSRPPLLLPTMLQIYKEEELEVPEGVTVAVKARVITVTGPRGTLQKNAQHVAMSIRVIEQKVGPAKVKLVVWHGARKMRLVYAHFPINVIIADDKKSVEIRNFLGEKRVRHVQLLDGVTISESKSQKDEIVLEGNDVDMVSQSAASIHGQTLVRNKDIRKFLDGIYVSEKGTVLQKEE